MVKVALPALRRARAAGIREDHARVDALLATMDTLDDTCVLARLAGVAGRQARPP
ncbi:MULTISPECIES: triphosphoribosyl-dephospho-CoA synthase [Ralstonia solanacearum species complex]|uniref:triphosphoribosyl-dephospho-CoA synthase n=1 Tax=Ralstonia solanacearum species complex TaxID=3116862 RepID=UPI000B0DC25C